MIASAFARICSEKWARCDTHWVGPLPRLPRTSLLWQWFAPCLAAHSPAAGDGQVSFDEFVKLIRSFAGMPPPPMARPLPQFQPSAPPMPMGVGYGVGVGMHMGQPGPGFPGAMVGQPMGAQARMPDRTAYIQPQASSSGDPIQARASLASSPASVIIPVQPPPPWAL